MACSIFLYHGYETDFGSLSFAVSLPIYWEDDKSKRKRSTRLAISSERTLLARSFLLFLKHSFVLVLFISVPITISSNRRMSRFKENTND